MEAVFSRDELQVERPLEEAGVEPCGERIDYQTLVFRTGANRQFINGSPTTLTVLKNLGDELVDLHGPHDHQSLFSPENQLELLDSFARRR